MEMKLLPLLIVASFSCASNGWKFETVCYSYECRITYGALKNGLVNIEDNLLILETTFRSSIQRTAIVNIKYEINVLLDRNETTNTTIDDQKQTLYYQYQWTSNAIFSIVSPSVLITLQSTVVLWLLDQISTFDLLLNDKITLPFDVEKSVLPGSFRQHLVESLNVLTTKVYTTELIPSCVCMCLCVITHSTYLKHNNYIIAS